MEPQCQKLEARLKYFKNEKKEILLKCWLFYKDKVEMLCHHFEAPKGCFIK
jgi:hypothetical protein